MTTQRLHRALLVVLPALVPLGAFATEGGGGRPITGQQVTSNAGVVPPTPGFALSVTSIYFDGSMEKGRELSLGRQVVANLDEKVSYNLANLTYIWNTGAGRWNFASAIGLPVQYTSVEVGAGGSRRPGFSNSDSGTQFADILINPIVAGYHFSATDHLAISLPTYAPTGAYNPERLANAGQNTWTFSPTLSYTKLFKGGGEFSAVTAVDFYTRNSATDYKNGAVFRLDAMWTAAIAPQWQLGVVGG